MLDNQCAGHFTDKTCSLCLIFCQTFRPRFYLQRLEIHRDGKLKVFLLFRTFSRLSYDKTRYFTDTVILIHVTCSAGHIV